MPYVSEEHGKFLLRVSRLAIENYIRHNRKISKPINTPAELESVAGVFLNIYKKVPIAGTGELRGSMGIPFAQKPLIDAVIESAIDAAAHSKFEPVKLQELPVTQIELHVINEPEQLVYKSDVDFFEKIKIGQHGFIISKSGRTGLMLPSIPLKKKWSSREALGNLCIDYGLKPESWKDPSANFWIFTTQVFRDRI